MSPDKEPCLCGRGECPECGAIPTPLAVIDPEPLFAALRADGVGLTWGQEQMVRKFIGGINGRSRLDSNKP
jgi:hypothetical protein